MPLVHRTNQLVLMTFSIFIVILFSACADKIKTNLIAFRELNESLVKSNKIVQNATEHHYHSLQNKLTDVTTAERARIWEAKAAKIRAVSSDMIRYIESVKSSIREEVGGTGKDSFKESDKSAVMRLFTKKGKGGELYDRLQKCRKEFLAIDETISRQFSTSLSIISESFDSSVNGQVDFTKTFFHDIPAIAALAMLSRLQSNIVIAENKMTEFCDNKVGSTGDRLYDAYLGFAAISSGCTQPNEQVEITAGIGAFSKSALPEISINGKNVPLDSDGAAHYKFKASDKPGKHVVSVKISYTNRDGSQQEIVKEVEYKVAAN